MTLSVNGAGAALAALQALQTSTSSSVQAADATTAPTSTQPTASIEAPSGVQGLFGLVDAMGQAISAADAAGAAGQSVVSLLQGMRDNAAKAADPTTSDADRQTLDAAFRGQAAGVGEALGGASVNGMNLVDGSMRSPVRVQLGDGASASLSPQDLTLGGPTLKLPAGSSIATATAAASAFDTLGAAIGATGAAISTLQAQGDRISAHGAALLTFSQALGSSTDDSGDSARLLALQVGQQLSTTSAAIANQSSQPVLALFRS